METTGRLPPTPKLGDTFHGIIEDFYFILSFSFKRWNYFHKTVSHKHTLKIPTLHHLLDSSATQKKKQGLEWMMLANKLSIKLTYLLIWNFGKKNKKNTNKPMIRIHDNKSTLKAKYTLDLTNNLEDNFLATSTTSCYSIQVKIENRRVNLIMRIFKILFLFFFFF